MHDRRSRWPIAAPLLLGVAGLFFLGDAIGDVQELGFGWHVAIESGIATGLMVGAALGVAKLRALVVDARRSTAAIQAASGAMADLMRLRFAEWRLTGAEADVALLAMKGLGSEEIAAIRGAAPGTVRAQLTRIYAKAGVHSRSGLIGLFIEDLLSEPLRPSAPAIPAPAPLVGAETDH